MWRCVRMSVGRCKQIIHTTRRIRADPAFSHFCSIDSKCLSMADHTEALGDSLMKSSKENLAQSVVSKETAPPQQDGKCVSRDVSEKTLLSKRAIKRMKRQQERQEKSEERKAKKKKKNSYLPEVDLTKETSYYFENGLRKVYPYTFTFSTYAKGRWVGRKLLEVFCHEFKHYPESVFREKLLSGQVSVNNSIVGVDYVIKIHDHITHVAHRHEVPVTADPIEILHDSDEILVINKPSSIPCHPCGCFRHNSVTFILNREYGYKNIKFVHRIDRLTSGLLLLAKNLEKAAEISRQVSGRQLEKEYICRVEGNFPSGIIECKKPIGLLSHKLGIQYVTDSGKPAWTTFERVSYNGKSSVVRCFPHTGRTHQIRVHLQYLGYPIINDLLYNSDCWGPNKGKEGDFGKNPDEVVALIMKNHDKMKYIIPDIANLEVLSDVDEKTEGSDDSKPDTKSMVNNDTVDTTENNVDCDNTSPGKDVNCSVSKQDNSLSGTMSVSQKECILDRPSLDPSKMTFDPTCLDCRRQFKDPKPEELVMYLHALRYKGPDWEFSTPLPHWAASDWKE